MFTWSSMLGKHIDHSNSACLTWPVNTLVPAVQQADIVTAAANGDTAKVRRLINQHADLEAKDHQGKTALLCAAAGGHVALVKLLLAHGASLHASDYYGRFALMLASSNGHVEVVKWLLSQGASRDASSWQLKGATAYELALSPLRHKVLEVLTYWPQPSGNKWKSFLQAGICNPVDRERDQRLLSKYLIEAPKYKLAKAAPKKDPVKGSETKQTPKSACLKIEGRETQPTRNLVHQKPRPGRPGIEHLLNVEPWWDEGVAMLKSILRSLNLCVASKEMQKQSYLGNHADLLAYMKVKGKKTMTTAAVRTWLENNGRFPLAYAKQGISLEDCDIDHILPRSVGGVNHPYNYYILPKQLNKRWSGWWTAHKMTYMGAANAKAAKNFFLWVRDEGERLRIDYNAYDQQRLIL